MAASTNAVSLRKVLLPLLCAALACIVFAAVNQATAQSSLDEVHITPREATVAVAKADYSPDLALAARAASIRTNVDLVLVPVSVIDGMQRLVTGLDQENFQVFEGKKSLPIKHFSSEDAPISVGILVDASGSMKNKIDRAREAVTQFCGAANLQDEFFLITFSSQPHLLTGFTRPEEIPQHLLFAKPGGETALLDALYMGLREMQQAKYSKKALLLISDGGDNHSRYSERELTSAVKESDVMIYAIGTFDRNVPTQEELLGPSMLADVAAVTGGRAFVLDNPNDMPAVAHRIGTELRTQYVLGYQPDEIPHNGRWHKIRVKLILPKHLPFFRVHARTGYYAANDASLDHKPAQ